MNSSVSKVCDDAYISKKQFCKLCGISPRRLIYLCENGIVLAGNENSISRGVPRKFTAENVKQFFVGKALRQVGFEMRVVSRMIKCLESEMSENDVNN